MSPRALMIGLGLLVGAATGAGAQSASVAGLPSIVVEGQASADLVPDTANLSVGIAAERPSAIAATAEVARVAQAVTDQIKLDGIAEKDVVTTSIALTPIFPEDVAGASGQPRPPRAFRASTDFHLTVKPADRAGLIAAHLVDKGANTIDGIVFSSSEAPHRLDDLRADAARDALHKAQIYVAALNLRLGRVLEITPQGDGGLQPMSFARAASPSIMAAPTPKIPVAPGSLSLRQSVSVRWELLQ